MGPSRYSNGFMARFVKLLCLWFFQDCGLNFETAKGKLNDRRHHVLL